MFLSAVVMCLRVDLIGEDAGQAKIEKAKELNTKVSRFHTENKFLKLFVSTFK